MSYVTIHEPSKTTTYRDAFREPIIVKSGSTITGLISPADDYNFAAGAGTIPDGLQGFIRIGPGVTDYRISGLTIEGRPFGWWDARKRLPYVYPHRGIAIAGGAGSGVIENCTISDLYCGEGIAARDYAKLTLKNIKVERCLAGVGLLYPYMTGNGDTTVDGLVGVDMAATDFGNHMGPSIKFPGQCTGNNTFYAEGCGSLKVSNVQHRGEGKGVKIWRARVLTIDRLEAQQLWLGGDLTPLPAGYKGTLVSESITVTNSVLGGSVFGMGHDFSADAIPLFVRYATQRPIEISKTLIIGPRPGAHGGQSDWRYEFVAVQENARVHLASTVRLLDLRGDLPDPSLGRGWFATETGGTVTDESTHERVIPQWVG